jgi:hypothetical protein
MTKAQDIPWRRIAVEAAAIVVSILLAFGIDAWWDSREEAQDELVSLELIRRDLDESIKQLKSHIEYARSASQSALNAYVALSKPGPYDKEYIRNEMLRVNRVTLRTPKAAYTELLSTGRLGVIEDRDLRDAIIRYYESIERVELIIQNNNDVYLDDQLMGTYARDGLVLSHVELDVGNDVLNKGFEIIGERLGQDFVHLPDPFWEFPPDSREWRKLRSTLLNAARVHALSETNAQSKIADATALIESIDHWLHTR